NAIDHGHLGLGKLGNTSRIQNGRNTFQLTGAYLARCQMKNRQHGVGLTATKSSLQLNDRITTLPAQTLSDRRQQQPHTFSNEGAGEEHPCILVVRRCCTSRNLSDVSSELGLFERTFQHVLVGAGNFTPGFKAHRSTSSAKGEYCALLYQLIKSKRSSASSRCQTKAGLPKLKAGQFLRFRLELRGEVAV